MEGLMQVPYNASVRLMLSLLERNVLPDTVARKLTRLLLASRLRWGYQPSSQLQLSHLIQFAHCQSLLSSSLSFFLFFFPLKCIYMHAHVDRNPSSLIDFAALNTRRP